eukprot:13750106-Alexandrium_andersonii.AAC.1
MRGAFVVGCPSAEGEDGVGLVPSSELHPGVRGGEVGGRQVEVVGGGVGEAAPRPQDALRPCVEADPGGWHDEV